MKISEKADIKDLKIMESNISIIHGQLSQLGVLMTEHLKVEMNNSQDSKSKIMKTKKEMLKNVNIFINWMNKPFKNEIEPSQKCESSETK